MSLRESESVSRVVAIFPADKSVSENRTGDISAAAQTSDDKSVVDDAEWFAESAQQLLSPKPGTAMHFLTGFDERSCQRYAAGDVKPPAYLLRAILRSDQGWQWLQAVMAGSDARWWIELQTAKRVGEFAIREAAK